MPPAAKLMNRNFLLLWQGQLVSRIGAQGFSIAMLFWIKHETGSATLMGTLMMFSQLPALLLRPVGGTLADRYSRRRIIVVSDLLKGVSVLSLAALCFVRPQWTGGILVWLCAVAVFSAAVDSFFSPAISAAIPDLVPADKVARANSLRTISDQGGRFIGQALGGMLFRLLGAPFLFLIDGLTYLFSALSESFIAIPQAIPTKSKGWAELFRDFKRDTAAGFGYVWGDGGMRSFVWVNIILGFFLPPILLLLPFYVEDTLQAPPDWYGFLWAAFSLAAVLGSLGAGFIKVAGPARSGLCLVCLLGFAVGLGGLGLVRTPLVALGLMTLVGLLVGYVGINLVTILQLSVPTQMRGRVLGVLDTLGGAAYPVSMGLAGVVADLTGQNIPLIYTVCGGMAALLLVGVALKPDFRRFLAFEVEAESA
ncbi:MAG: MFS transporter [Candidatus Latescibacteria bacterium]|nr:MFS transporter [Candidatus Latescibacterota bacterium]